MSEQGNDKYPFKLIVDEERERQRFLGMVRDRDKYPLLAKSWEEWLEQVPGDSLSVAPKVYDRTPSPDVPRIVPRPS